jgi:hypothetical protein
MLDEKQFFTEHVKYVKQKANKVAQKVASLAIRHFRLPLKVVKQYESSILTSVVAYGASVWAHRLSKNVKLASGRWGVDLAQRQFLIRVTGAYRTTPNDSLTLAIGTMPLHLTIILRGANYWLKKGRLDRLHALTGGREESKQEIREGRLDAWQREWETSENGRRLYESLPNVRDRLRIKHLAPERGLIHFLTGHGPYNRKLNELGLSETPDCDCGQVGSPEHTVLECPQSRNFIPNRNLLRATPLGEVLADEGLYKDLQTLCFKVSQASHERHRNQ